jgi:hypothetical protein
MKRWLKFATLAIALVVVAVLLLGASAFAKGPAEKVVSPTTTARGYGIGYMGERNRGGQQDSLVAVAAKVLNMSQADLVAELDSKTIAAVAKEKGVAIDKIVSAFLAPREEALKNAVATGKLTQAQADQMLATMKANVTKQLNNTWTPRGAGLNRDFFVDKNNDGVCDNRD